MDMQAARIEQVAKLERLVMLEAQETDWANGAAESNGTLREMCLMNLRRVKDALTEARAEYGEFEEALIQAEVAADLAEMDARIEGDRDAAWNDPFYLRGGDDEAEF